MKFVSPVGLTIIQLCILSLPGDVTAESNALPSFSLDKDVDQLELVQEVSLRFLEKEESPRRRPVDLPTFKPTSHRSTKVPTSRPTRRAMTLRPTRQPTAEPTEFQGFGNSGKQPSVEPSPEPTLEPTYGPTSMPTLYPTSSPTGNPSIYPTHRPTAKPTKPPKPTRAPSPEPTTVPTISPTTSPSSVPTAKPTTANPTGQPTAYPTISPTKISEPTSSPTTAPTAFPTAHPTTFPTQTNAPTETRNVMQLIQAKTRYAAFKKLVEAADLNDFFEGTNSLTVFLPSNGAIKSALGAYYFQKLLNDPAFSVHVSVLVRNHVTNEPNGPLWSKDFVEGAQFTTLGGEPVSVGKHVEMKSDGTEKESPTLITFAASGGFTSEVHFGKRDIDYPADNGVLHEVSDVMTPLFYFLDLVTLLGFLRGRFSTLNELIVLADMEQSFQKIDDATLIAPCNTAFENVDSKMLDYLRSPDGVDDLTKILSYHLIPTLVNVFNLPPNENINLETILDGYEMTLRVELDDNENIASFTADDAAIETLFLAKDQIIYSVDTLLFPPNMDIEIPAPPPPTSAPTVTRMDDTLLWYIHDTADTFDFLSVALESIGADGMGHPDKGPFTFFAADDYAFVAAFGDDGEYIEMLRSDNYFFHMRSLVLYQIVPSDLGELRPTDLVDNLSIRMANGLTIRVKQSKSDEENGLIRLTTSSSDQKRTPEVYVDLNDRLSFLNGIMYRDLSPTPLIPFWYFFSTLDAMETIGSFSKFQDYLNKVPGLISDINELESEGQGITILGPTNDAFALLPKTMLDYFDDTGNIGVLKQVLEYHIIPTEVVPVVRLPVGDTYFDTLAGGESITITAKETSSPGKNAYTCNGISFSTSFFTTKKSLLYQLEDGVLIPESLRNVIPGADLLPQFEAFEALLPFEPEPLNWDTATYGDEL